MISSQNCDGEGNERWIVPACCQDDDSMDLESELQEQINCTALTTASSESQAPEASGFVWPLLWQFRSASSGWPF
jgi:hypothetical protein